MTTLADGERALLWSGVLHVARTRWRCKKLATRTTRHVPMSICQLNALFTANDSLMPKSMPKPAACTCPNSGPLSSLPASQSHSIAQWQGCNCKMLNWFATLKRQIHFFVCLLSRPCPNIILMPASCYLTHTLAVSLALACWAEKWKWKPFVARPSIEFVA